MVASESEAATFSKVRPVRIRLVLSPSGRSQGAINCLHGSIVNRDADNECVAADEMGPSGERDRFELVP